jgi:ribose transport system substrate-binding protein
MGEKPTWYTSLTLTPQQLQTLHSHHYTAAFLNWDASAYNQAIEQGARDAFEAMGIDLVATTNYHFNSGQLQSDVLNVMPLRPNIIMYSGVNPVSDRAALAPAVNAGTAIVAYANAPQGWRPGHPNEFVTLISYDTYRMGAVVADAVHERFPRGADVGMIYFDADYKLVNERERGFLQELKKYPTLRLIDKAPMTDPYHTDTIASAMLARHPHLNVIFAPWDLPSEGVDAALNGARRKDIKVASIDLGFTGAQDIATNGHIFVEASDLVYEWGRTGAIAAALHLLGKKVPPYVIVPAFAVTKAKLIVGWQLAYGPHVPLPSAVLTALRRH